LTEFKYLINQQQNYQIMHMNTNNTVGRLLLWNSSKPIVSSWLNPTIQTQTVKCDDAAVTCVRDMYNSEDALMQQMLGYCSEGSKSERHIYAMDGPVASSRWRAEICKMDSGLTPAGT